MKYMSWIRKLACLVCLSVAAILSTPEDAAACYGQWFCGGFQACQGNPCCNLGPCADSPYQLVQECGTYNLCVADIGAPFCC